jgi:hypothetical protein
MAQGKWRLARCPQHSADGAQRTEAEAGPLSTAGILQSIYFRSSMKFAPRCFHQDLFHAQAGGLLPRRGRKSRERDYRSWCKVTHLRLFWSDPKTRRKLAVFFLSQARSDSFSFDFNNKLFVNHLWTGLAPNKIMNRRNRLSFLKQNFWNTQTHTHIHMHT